MIHVTSEIKPLKEVLVHRPGKELLNLTPDTLGRLLFDDIPYLKDAQAEHDEFVQILRDNGIKVVYLENLMAETLDANPQIRPSFIRQFIYEAGVRTPMYKDLLFDYLNSFTDNLELVLKTMEGIKVKELGRRKKDIENSLVDLVSEEGKF